MIPKSSVFSCKCRSAGFAEYLYHTTSKEQGFGRKDLLAGACVNVHFATQGDRGSCDRAARRALMCNDTPENLKRMANELFQG